MIAPSFPLLAAAAGAFAGVALAGPIEARAPTGNFKDIMIKGHNWYRSEHAAGPLRWDDGAAANANAWVQNCKFEHQVSKQPAPLPAVPSLFPSSQNANRTLTVQQ